MKALKIIIAIAVFLAAAAAVLFFVLRKFGRDNILDGPGSIFEWPSYHLYGNWVEIRDDEPVCQLKITKDQLVYTGYTGEQKTYTYSIPEDVSVYGIPEKPVTLQIEGQEEYENLIFHMESLEDDLIIPIISGTLFEMDGRGEIVDTEFVRTEDADKLPEGYRSQLFHKLKDRDPVPSFVTTPTE